MGITNKTITALNGIPFGSMIGGPLSACIEAQAEAAQTTVDFIESVGLEKQVDKDGNEKKNAVYVYFQFIQGGRKVVINVPLLTIVPVPYIAITTVDINFKATVTGVETDSLTNTLSNESTTERNSSKRSGWFGSRKTNIKSSYSTKKDSKTTQDSSYSIEATIDVAVHASQDSMPAGMAKILEMLGSAIDLCDPTGELTVNDTLFSIKSGEKAELIVMYKTSEGLYTPEGILAGSKKPDRTTVDSAIFELTEGTYKVTAGDKEVTVKVEKVGA